MNRLFLIGIVLLSFARAASADGPAYRRLAEVPFTKVQFHDGFWTPRLETNRAVSLPHNFEWCAKTGRISNFAKAGKLVSGKFEGIFFNDSDVYKVLEGASYSLAAHPDPALEKTVDDVIAKIASAQQPDGYLNTFFTLAEPGRRWTNLRDKHELYCAGHLIEAAVAHWRATGKRTLLDVAVRYADYIDTVFGPTKRQGCCGHEEIELALVKLYQATDRQKYLDLANYFIDVRGNKSQRPIWGIYYQDHRPVRDQREIGGHAVRAMYLYCATADVAAYTGDRRLIEALHALWRDVVSQKMYVTGGIGARRQGEAFGDAYELPNDTAYCETCAAIGLALWAHRMNLLEADAQYVDTLERALYNGVLSGIGMDGKRFFYVNPLASDGTHHRQPFFSCACCPSNVVRLVPSLPGYVYAVTGGKQSGKSEAVFVNLYVAGTADVPLSGNKVKLTQETRYPWDGAVRLTVSPEKAGPFAVCLRIPGWCRGAKKTSQDSPLPLAGEGPGVSAVGAATDLKISVNGELLSALNIEKGYACIEGSWQRGDVIELNMSMPVERIEANPQVAADRGRVAVQRGPIVYCFEAADNGGKVKDIALAADPQLAVECRKDLLGGVYVVTGLSADGRKVTAIPYYAWDHRSPGEMIVWVKQQGKPADAPTDDPAWKDALYRAR
jgi:uncharacterized protein